jgi:hypothetical protein
MNRYLVYADLLGTKNAYDTPKDVVRLRQLLEQTIDAYFVPVLEEHDICIYVFNDTLIATCPSLEPLLNPTAQLFNHFLNLTLNRENKPIQFMLMRGAISFGEPATSTVLKSTERVTVIPILDESLPKAYKLEGLRKGSRVFIDPELPELKSAATLGNNNIIKWISITGHGQPKRDVGEFLWPLHIPNHNIEKTCTTMFKIRKMWLNLLGTKEWEIEEYDKSIYHLDETLKLYIRALSNIPSTEYIQNALCSLLPNECKDYIDVKFEWGVWFQAIKGIIESEETHKIRYNLLNKIEIIKNIMQEDNYWDSFLTELEKPDYLLFKNKYDNMILDR